MLTAFRSFLSSTREKELETQIANLNKENSTLTQAIRDKDRALKLHVETITEIRSHRPMNDVEWETFKNQAGTIASLQGQLDELALWLRNNKKAEIAAGLHNGQGGLVKVIIGYLSRSTVIPVNKGGGGEQKGNVH